MRVNDRKFEFSDAESTRACARAVDYFMAVKRQEMDALREELAPREKAVDGERPMEAGSTEKLLKRKRPSLLQP